MTTALPKRGVIVTLVVALAASALAGTPALAAPRKPKPQEERIVRGEVVKPQAAAQYQTGTPFKGATAVWPKAKVIEVDPGALRTSRNPEPSGPVKVLPAGKPGKNVKIETFDRAKSQAAGVEGLVFRVTGGEAKVSVDYSSFRWAYGGDWASRLRLVELPECALSTPDKPECVGKAVPSTNDIAKGRVTAAQPSSDKGALMAVTAGPSGPTGDYSATKLAPSATWSAGGNSGGFNWSYDMRTPPGLNGPSPKLSLSYSSASVDGQMAASNNQPSWIGEGFQFGSNFIERRYKSCRDDMTNGARNTVETSDRCWATENASLVMDGRAGELLKDASNPNLWHLRSEDGTRVERRIGGGITNGAKDNEHWVVTTTDGTQYWFGRSGQSTLTVPVAGNHAGEPCAQAAFKDSFCTQAYRWELEYVVDLHGNTMTYTYGKETNKYGRNNTATDAVQYDRSSHLKQIDYGTRTDRTETAPMQVVFETADRCLSDCGIHDAKHWTDVPWEQSCDNSPCRTHAPTFWTTKRLSAVTTKVGGNAVEKWTFGHSFPDPGDGTRAGLWLDKISHEGLVGGTTTLPDITFVGEQLSNRVDTHSDQRAAMKWWRLKQIHTETGGRIDVDYSKPDCTPGSRMPNANALQDNNLRCYPVRWTADGLKDPILDFFHKYVVTGVTEFDQTSGSQHISTKYDYVGAPAWHYTDDDGFIKSEDKTWSVWRGYEKVVTTKGDLSDRTRIETRYFRGMHGDKLPSGTRNVILPAIAAGGVPEAPDEDAYAGMPREEITYNGPGGAEVSASASTPWQSPPTASRTINGVTVYARHAKVSGDHKRTALDGNRGHHTTSTHTHFDNVYGMPMWVENRGDDAVEGDEKCVLTDYARNTSTWLVSAVSRNRTFVTNCTKARFNLGDVDVAGDTRSYFDAQALGAAPTKGEVTIQETLKSYKAGVATYIKQLVNEYDAYGRVTKVTDPKGSTTTAYTPAAGGPVTQVTATNALGWTTTTQLQPAWNLPLSLVDSNQKRTDIAYDGLGRTTAVWLRGRQNDTTLADKTFSYLVRKNGPVTVTTKSLNQDYAYVTSYQLFDGLLRPRQTQSADATGNPNAVVTDHLYDTAGREVRKNNPYVAVVSPGPDLFKPVITETIPSQARSTFDGAGRVTLQELVRNAPVDGAASGDVVQESKTAYAGDRVDVTPPTGDIATSTVFDAVGRTKERRQYHAGVSAGTPDPAKFDVIKYTYDPFERLDTVKAPSGHVWDYDHDLRGRQTRTVDPDKGTTTLTYDDADQLESTTDDRDVTLAFTYDAIGRKTSVRQDSKTGPLRAEWVYDRLNNGTTTNGVLAKSIRHEGSNAYVTENLEFNKFYQPVKTTFTVPASETGLAGTYRYENLYHGNGVLDIMRVPALGDLQREVLNLDYDGLGKPKSVASMYGTASNGTLVTNTQYTSFGELAVYELRGPIGNDVDVSRVYETTTRRLSQIWTQKQTSPSDVSRVDYSYDAAGNVTKIADSVSGDTQCFRTDYLRRLTDAWTPSSGSCTSEPTAGLGGPAKYWQSYTYNTAGDRTGLVEQGTAPAKRSVTYTPYAGKHSLASAKTTDGDGTRTATYTYDDAGNMLTRPAPSGGTQTMTWDAEGHMATSSDSIGTTSYLYDADGNRMIRRDPGGKTLYLPGQELRVTSSGARSATRYYSYAGQTVGVRTSAGLQWMSSDRNGTAETTIADDGAQTVRTRRMMPFGEPRGDNKSWLAFLDKGFVGGTLDPSGLTHIGAREYEPSTGRFISVDPIMDLKDPQQMHGYSYSNNSPVTFSDPTGLAYCDYNVCFGDPGYNPDGPRNNKDGKCVVNCHNKHNTPSKKVDHSKPNRPSSCEGYGYHAKDACIGAQSYTPSPAMTTSEKWHLGLGLLGLTPGFGEPADVGDCALYAHEGKPFDAALSCGSAVPIWGWAPALIKMAKNGRKVGKGTEEAAEAAAHCVRPNSFSGGTLILMADGSTKRIDQIKVGDKIANSDMESEETRQDVVLVVHVTDADKEYVDLAIATPDGPKTIITTAHHLFYNATTHTWSAAGTLKIGDELNTPGNGRTTILATSHYTAVLRTYDLTIDTLPTFYVLAGTMPVLVHNTGPCDHVALGLSEHVKGFGESVGGRHLMGDADWKSAVLQAAYNPNARFSVNLDGVEDLDGVLLRGRYAAAGNTSARINGRAPSPFEWEMHTLNEANAWGRTTFYLDGKVVDNPFGG